MTYDELVALAREYPEVDESTSYGDPAVKRKGRAMFALKKDGETVAMKMDWENRDRFLGDQPDVFYITEHYYGWPWLLVRLAELTPELGEEIVRLSYEDAPNKNKTRDAP